jgi:hypothetical protein
MHIRKAILFLILVTFVGCGSGKDKGINKGEDKPVPADKTKADAAKP